MIVGLGIDSVEIERFASWHTKPWLGRILSAQEIDYCLSNTRLAPQRFAVRFAAREALYKALSGAIPGHTIPFLTLCRAATLENQNSPPALRVDWKLLQPHAPPDFQGNPLHILVSLTHTRVTATAIVIIEKNKK
jgi:holo-[acyl-carrier protein] synthase